MSTTTTPPTGTPPDREALGTFLFKAALVAIIAAAFVIPLSLLAMPYIEFFNDMAIQPKAKAQGLYGRTSGERLVVERAALPGTIPQGYRPYPFEGTGPGTAIKAGEELANPLAPVTENVERGRHVYEIYCVTCHGKLGDGDGPVVGPNRFPAPPSLTTKQVKGYRDGHLYHVITRGQNSMPSYAEIVPPHDRWAAIHFVRALWYTIKDNVDAEKEGTKE